MKKELWQFTGKNRVEIYQRCKKRADGVVGDLVAVGKRIGSNKWRLFWYAMVLAFLSGCATSEPPRAYRWQYYPGYWSLEAQP